MKKHVFGMTGLATLLALAFLPGPQVRAEEPAAAPHPATARVPGFEDLAERLLPTVVNVSTTEKLKSPVQGELPPMPELPPGSPFEQFFKNFYDQYQNG